MRTDMIRAKLRSEVETLQLGQNYWYTRKQHTKNPDDLAYMQAKIDAFEEQVKVALDAHDALAQLETLQHGKLW